MMNDGSHMCMFWGSETCSTYQQQADKPYSGPVRSFMVRGKECTCKIYDPRRGVFNRFARVLRRTPVFELLLVDQTPPVLVVDGSITSWSDASTVLKEGTCLALLFMRCVSTDGPWDSGSYDLVKQLLEKPLPLIKGVRSPDYREMIEHSFRVQVAAMEALTSEPIVIQLDTPNCPVAFEILNQLQLNRVPPIGDNAFGAVMLNPMPQVATQRIEIRMHADVRWCFDLAEVRKGIGVNCSGKFNSAFSAVPRKHLTNYLESRTYPRRTMTSILEENRLVHAGLLDRPVYCAAMCALFRGKYDSPKPSYLPDQIPHDPLHMVGNHTKNKAYAA